MRSLMVFAVCLLFLTPMLVQADDLISSPDAVVYDTLHSRYLVTCRNADRIVQIDAQGEQTLFTSDLEMPTGLHLAEDRLYVLSNAGPDSGLSAFDLETGEKLFSMVLPGMDFLMDVAADTSGYLYVTEYHLSKIYQVDPVAQTCIVFVEHGLVSPNGLLFDAPNNRMLVVNAYGAGEPICAVDLPSGILTTIVEVGVADLGGLTIDTSGNYYIRAWVEGRIYKYDHDFTNPPEVWMAGLTSPAQICYNQKLLELAIPEYSANRLTIVPDPYARDSDADGTVDAYDNCLSAYNPGQEDEDNDDAGDACDNCLGLYNPGQEDINQNGIGDDCETNRSWYVALDGSGDATTIQDGIDLSTHGDTVIVADGTYTGAGENVIDFGGRRRILFRSENGPQSTIIDCQGTAAEPRRGCAVETDADSTMVIDGFTIRNGYGPLVDGAPTGGGMMIKYASVTVRNCIFTNNYAVLGGAVFAREANPRFINCTFAGNSGSYGAGLAASFNGHCILENCIVAYNGPGAAVYCYGLGSADLFCCDVYGNFGGNWTGCLYGQGSIEGNFSADPGFCNLSIGDVGLASESSPCTADNTGCGVLVGACDIGCSCYCGYHCDVNLDGDINPVDVVYMVNFVYKSLDGREQDPVCVGENGDWNCDEQVNPVDVVYFVNFVYKSVEAGPCDPCADEAEPN